MSDGRSSRDAALAALLGALLAVVYWAGRCPTFGPGDSPQHVLSAITWGVSWPPGYPLYTLLGHLASLIPGAPAAHVNALSGLLHAAAAALFFLLLRRLEVARVPALAATALMAFSPLWWYYSEIAEVRALNDLLAVAAALLAAAWIRDRRPAALFGLAAVFGLGVSHHPTYVLLVPAFAWWLWSRRALPDRRRAAAAVALALACCALPYALLAVRLRAGLPAYDLTGVATPRDVLDLFLRRSLGGPFRVVAGEGLLGPGGFDFPAFRTHASWFFGALLGQLTPAGLFLAGIGVIAGWKTRREQAVFWLLWLAVTAFAYVLMASQQIHLHDPAFARAVALRFYVLPLIGAFALAACGAERLIEASSPPVGWGLLAAALLLPVFQHVEARDKNFTMDYAREAVRETGPNDLLLLDTDAPIFAMLYLDLVERSAGERVLLLPSLFSFPPYRQWLKARHPDLKTPPDEFWYDWKAWLALNPGRNLYAEAEWKDNLMSLFPGSAPSGVLDRTSEAPLPPAEARAGVQRLLDSGFIREVSRDSVYPFTQDVDYLRVSRIMLEWSKGFATPEQAAALDERLKRL